MPFISWTSRNVTWKPIRSLPSGSTHYNVSKLACCCLCVLLDDLLSLIHRFNSIKQAAFASSVLHCLWLLSKLHTHKKWHFSRDMQNRARPSPMMDFARKGFCNKNSKVEVLNIKASCCYFCHKAQSREPWKLCTVCFAWGFQIISRDKSPSPLEGALF